MPHDPPEVIKQSYRRLVMQYHPDLNPGQNNTLLLQEINEAFEVLSDSEKKRAYDLQLYHYLKSLHSQCNVSTTCETTHQPTKHHRIYVKKRIKIKSSTDKSKFIHPKDIIAPLIIIAFFTLIAFYIRYKNDHYKIEPFQKSTIKIDIYSVNLAGKLPHAYLPNDFFEYTQMSQLDLSNNQLYYLSPKFGNFKKLKALNLNNNLITHLHDGFTVMKEMVFLNLSNNPLKEFPEEVLCMNNLEVLWLDNCELRKLPLEKMHFPKLKYLFLSKNPISENHREEIRKKFSKCYVVF